MRLTRLHLFVAFAFTVMADPVSSIAYAIEAALRALDGDLGSLVATMVVVIGIIVVVSLTYHQLIGRFPEGGGGPQGVAAAFGEGWAFLPLGALLVDFTLTVAVSCSAGAAALIAYAPALAAARVAISLGLASLVAAGVLLGHRGRIGFALATQLFIAVALVVILAGAFDGASVPLTEPAHGGGSPALAGTSLAAVVFAFPLGMALATGVEAPSNAIAQLPQLGRRARIRFGRGTLWLMVGIVGSLTMAVAVLAVHLGVGRPSGDSTLLADVAKRILGDGAVFGLFQVLSALLLLAAAASSYLAGSGVLKALAAVGTDGDGLLPARLHRENRFLVAHWGVLVVLAIAAAMILAARGHEQDLVQFYAVSVFASFLAATLACARLTYRDGRRGAMAVNLIGAVLITCVLGLNLTRLDSAIALLSSVAVALDLWRTWVARGRPRGVASAV
ncbi:MAG TPA: amino acid permease [Solirubrobacterales bacterium]|nr:amino acid permease [Solirubrobacterales bacterium]